MQTKLSNDDAQKAIKQYQENAQEIISALDKDFHLKWKLSDDGRTIRDNQDQPVGGLVVSRMKPETLVAVLYSSHRNDLLLAECSYFVDMVHRGYAMRAESKRLLDKIDGFLKPPQY